MKKFFKTNGYYFILIACVVALCIGGIAVLEKRAADNTKLPTQLNNGNNINASGEATKRPAVTLKPSSADYPDPTEVPTVEPTAAPTKTPATEIPTTQIPATEVPPTIKPSFSEDKEDSTEVNKPVEKPSGDSNSNPAKFVLPVGKLTIVSEFADNKLVYNKTLREWRIHPAVDLAAEAGSNVVCAANGTVADIKNDPLYGTTVVIDHGNELSTVYCGIVVGSDITVGKDLKVGTVIGTVSSGGIFCEKDIGSHIHFEVIQNGKKINPETFFDTATSTDEATSENNTEALG